LQKDKNIILKAQKKQNYFRDIFNLNKNNLQKNKNFEIKLKRLNISKKIKTDFIASFIRNI